MCNLSHDVRRGAKAVDAKTFTITCPSQTSVSDQTGAEQRSGFCITVEIRNRETKALIRNRVICITAIDGVAGKARLVAKILSSPETIRALSAGPAQPWNTDTIADFKALGVFAFRFHNADYLVARDQWKFRLR